MMLEPLGGEPMQWFHWVPRHPAYDRKARSAVAQGTGVEAWVDCVLDPDRKGMDGRSRPTDR